MDKNSIMLLLNKGTTKVILSNNLISKKGCGFFPVDVKVESI